MDDAIEELRASAAAVPPAPSHFERYLAKVRTAAYKVTDDDVERLRAAGASEDEIFEQTVAAAVGEGLRRLDVARRVIG